MREHAHHFRVFCGESENRRLGGGEGGIRTPETLSSLHAFQACALSRARPPLHATRLLHHALAPRHIFRISISFRIVTAASAVPEVDVAIPVSAGVDSDAE